MTYKIFSAALLAVMFEVTALQAQTSNSLNITQNTGTIKIVRGNADTVYNASHVIVGVTAPGNTATVNGEQVHVYKTGSFGAEINLVPGENKIEVTTLPDNKTTLLSVFYNTTPEKKTMADSEGLTAKGELKDTNILVSTLDGAYLNYGNGTDRLGGAKINFLDKDINLHAVAVNDNLYKVQLSENRYAFIPKTITKALPEISQKITSTLSGSWSVSNVGKYDKVSIMLGEKRPYIVKQECNPGKIVLDLFGVQCNTNWITQYKNLKVIDYVDVEGLDSDIMRVTINLKNKTFWGYTVQYEGNSLSIAVKHAPDKFTLKGMVIGVDAGHGGADGNGAVSAAGHKEKDQNLAMAFMLKEMLEQQGAKVVMSRDSDYAKNNTVRVQEFKKNEIDLLISVHCNAGGNPLKVGGASTYYRHIEHRELAKHILAKILEIDGVKNFGLVGNFNFTLNSPTDFPSVLVETLFMSNLWDEEHITDSTFQKKMMEHVVAGLNNYLTYCKKQEK